MLKEILSEKEKYKIEYSKTNLNGDGERDYLIILENKNRKKLIMGIVMENIKIFFFQKLQEMRVVLSQN